MRKYTIKMKRLTAKGSEWDKKTIEADKYEREGRTYTFFRAEVPLATYENVREVESEEISS